MAISTSAGRDQHQVRQFVNNNNDVAQMIRDDDFLVARHDDFLVQFHGEAVRTGLDFFLLGHQRQFRLGGRDRLVFGALVEGRMLRTPTLAKIW
jgi:hypothetical protein